MIEKINQVPSAANVSSQSADRLGESADLNVHPAVHLEVIDSATAIAAQNAGGVSVVHHHDGAIFFRQIAKPGQRTDIAVHGEHAISDQQLLAGLIFDAGQLRLGVRNILVLEHQNFCAREPRAIDDRGVIQLVRDDEVVFAQHR